VRSVLSLMPLCRHTGVPNAWIIIDPSLHAVICSGAPGGDWHPPSSTMIQQWPAPNWGRQPAAGSRQAQQ